MTATEFEEDPRPAFEIEDILLVVWHRRLALLGLTVAGATVGLLMAASKPNVYTSHAKLLLRAGLREGLTPESLYGVARERAAGPSIQDELHLLSDEAIFIDVVEDVGPEAVLRSADPTRFDGPETPVPVRVFHSIQKLLSGVAMKDPEDGAHSGSGPFKAAVTQLQGGTALTAERNSNVITVRHTAADPVQARHLTQAIADALIDRHREQFSTEKYLEAARKKVDEARITLEATRQQHTDHLALCGLLESDARAQVQLTEEANALSRDIARAEVRRAEIRTELEILRERLETTPRTTTVVEPAVLAPNPEYATKTTLRVGLLREREMLPLEGLPLDEQRRKRERIDERLRVLESELAATEQRVVFEPERTEEVVNIDYAKLETRLADGLLEQEVLSTRIRELGALLETQKGRIAASQNCVNAHRMHLLSTTNAEKAYERLTDRLTTLESLAAIDLEGNTNLQLLQSAVFPLKKDGPNRKKIVLFYFFGGVFSGLFYSLVRESVDQRLRNVRSVRRHLSVPIVGTVPDAAAFSRR